MTNTIQVSYLVASEYIFFSVYSIAALSIVMSVLVYHRDNIDTESNKQAEINKKRDLRKIRFLGLLINTLILILLI